jgi:hypothetical protein
MKCARCHADNDEGARFCEDCGARLELVCPRCGEVGVAARAHVEEARTIFEALRVPLCVERAEQVAAELRASLGASGGLPP